MKINEQGIVRNKYVRKEALKMLIIGPIFSLTYIILLYISMSKWLAFFYTVLPFFILMTIFFFVVAPIIMLKRHNRTIKKISFEEGNIIIEVFSALWMKSNEYKFPKKVITISNSRFRWYGKKGEEKEGYTIKAGHDRTFYLVKDFFSDSDFDEIEKNLFN
jgi:hypothetical protein